MLRFTVLLSQAVDTPILPKRFPLIKCSWLRHTKRVLPSQLRKRSTLSIYRFWMKKNAWK